ncbi:MAG: HD-GYP domain-containing protein [Candidatus Dormibacteria bacterium]
MVLPFATLTLVIGLLSSVFVTSQLGTSAAAHLHELAIHQQDDVQAAFTSLEQKQLVDLRTVTGTVGVNQMAQAGDLAGLRDTVFPIVANQLPDPLTVVFIGANHDLLYRITAVQNGQDSVACDCTAGGDPGPWVAVPEVQQVLNGQADRYGNKYSGFALDAGRLYFVTVGPLATATSGPGALLAAEPVDSVLSDISQQRSFELALYRPDGLQVARSRDFPVQVPALSADQRREAQTSLGQVHVPVEGPGALSEVYFAPLAIRGRVVGFIGVRVLQDSVTQAGAMAAWIEAAIVLVALLAMALVGWFVSRRLTRPLDSLLRATAEVSRGNLSAQARVERQDEIGQLAESFNEMTRTLDDRTSRLEASTDATVLALAAAIDARDAYTHGHSLRVSTYSLALGRALGLNDAEMEIIRRGCLVHDVGKIGVADQVLRKPARLDDHEEAEMRRHPRTGYEMLRNLPWDPRVLEIVLHHHERWDGTGYPERVAGDAIPAVARLVAIADTLDAMTSDRPYRPAFSFADAAGEIRRGSGSQFDPAMVAAFERAHDELAELVGRLGSQRPAGRRRPVATMAS